MPELSLCVSCPNREDGICGAVLKGASEDGQLPRQWHRYQVFRAGRPIVSRNDPVEEVFVLCEGWAFRYLQLPDGRRQILNFLLPGDLLSGTTMFQERCNFSAMALTDIQVSRFRRADIQALSNFNPGILAAVGQTCLVEQEHADELTAALGKRQAEERVAYLLVQLTRRLAARNVIREQRYPFPLRQQHIADAVGLSSVHVSRVMGIFRERGLIEIAGAVLQVLNLDELKRIGAPC
jgi:CRP-like cAMP-binding protein